MWCYCKAHLSICQWLNSAPTFLPSLHNHHSCFLHQLLWRNSECQPQQRGVIYMEVSNEKLAFPANIAMGQIIKSLPSVCLSVCPSVCHHSYGRNSHSILMKLYTIDQNPIGKNPFVVGQNPTIHSPIFLQFFTPIMHCQWEVFSLRWKVSVLSAVQKCSGKLFLDLAAATLKARSPNLRCVLRTWKVL